METTTQKLENINEIKLEKPNPSTLKMTCAGQTFSPLSVDQVPRVLVRSHSERVPNLRENDNPFLLNAFDLVAARTSNQEQSQRPPQQTLKVGILTKYQTTKQE